MGRSKKEVQTEKQQEEIFEFDDDLTNNYVLSTKKFEQNIQTPMKLNDESIKKGQVIIFKSFTQSQYGFCITDTRDNKSYYTNKQVSRFLNEIIDKDICEKDSVIQNGYNLKKRVYLNMIERIETEEKYKDCFKYNVFEIKFLKN